MGKIALAEMISSLRSELQQAQDEGKDKELRFAVGDVELELQVTVTKEGTVGGGVKDAEVGSLLVQLNHRLNGERPDYTLPPGVTPDQIGPEPGAITRVFTVSQAGENLVLDAASSNPSGSVLARLESRNGLVSVEKVAEQAFWQGGVSPPWATSWGWDTYGAWVVFTHEGVQQRLRWIPPGRFLMGSPEEERGRSNDEGPQHEVTIKQGFWLFDTNCTQAMWQAVTGDNPSAFNSPDRPVENVNFEDVQKFLEKINQAHPGLELAFPSEAQWEYACRAGTTTPFSFGEDITTEQVNYDGNHPYRDGPKGEYRKQTVPVASLPPNPWGLYEMHGNVWERCADAWHDSYAKAPTDGSVWDGPSADRVIRGGSWFGNARNVRAADRDGNGPANRFGNLGFRCARVQVSQVGQGAEPMIPAFGPQAERGPTPGSSGTAKLLHLQGDGKLAMAPLSKKSAFVIKSDREILTFGQIEKPSWAEAMGRDRHGLWTRIAIDGPGSQPITQRLRWIPPGRFLMGSPENEHDRLDREGPQHEVTFKQGFWLFDTACTQALWQAVMEDNPSQFKSPDRPVENVDFENVQKFIEKINKEHSGLALTLPSEAQWEYACRAGTTTPFSFGEDITPEQVNYNGNNPYRDGPKGEYRKQTVPVASLPPNPWGLYEMHGNVWEWCADAWHETYAEAPADGSVWDGPSAVRVLRGGSWTSMPALCVRRIASGAVRRFATASWVSVAPEFSREPSRNKREARIREGGRPGEAEPPGCPPRVSAPGQGCALVETWRLNANSIFFCPCSRW